MKCNDHLTSENFEEKVSMAIINRHGRHQKNLLNANTLYNPSNIHFIHERNDGKLSDLFR